MILDYFWWYRKYKNGGIMEKITLSLRSTALKSQIKKYASKRGLTVSGIVENYLQNLIKIENRESGKPYGLPEDLDILLDGIEVNESLQTKDYKSLRNEMYENRTH
jgi:hypothetical protein